MRKTIHRILSLLLVLAMLCGFALPAMATRDQSAAEMESTSQFQPLAFEKLEDGTVTPVLGTQAVEEMETAPLYADTDMVRVSIVLEGGSTLDQGWSTLDIAQNAEAMAYRSSLKQSQAEVTASIERAIGGELDVQWNLTLAANIITANIQYGQMAEIAAVEGVESVFLETRYEPAVVDTEETVDPNMATSGEQIGSNLDWANGYTGAGSRIAVIDTGTDTDHQSFNAEAFEYSLQLQAEEAGMSYDEYVASLDLLDAEEITAVASQLNVAENNWLYSMVPDLIAMDCYGTMKLPFGYNYVDRDAFSITHDGDSMGEHGSHVAGIATANAWIKNAEGGFDKALDTVYVQGVAPDAQLITMKVFGRSGGAYESDYVAAIEDAIILGCDVVNLSLSTATPGYTTFANSNNAGDYQAIMDSLVESDTVVSISMGNSYSWTQYSASATGTPYADDVNFFTGGAPGVYTNSLAVASVDNIGRTDPNFTVGEETFYYNDSYKMNTSETIQPLTSVAGEYEYVIIDGDGMPAEWDATGISLEGKIAVCSRGTGSDGSIDSFAKKCSIAVERGALAVVVYNNRAGDESAYMNMTGYTYTQPAVFITQANGIRLKEASTPITDADGNVVGYTGTMIITASVVPTSSDPAYYTMSDFSSWGVPSNLSMKPEITAPGGSIYSVNGADKSGTAYENMFGTSMAAPQITGMAAVVAQYIRENGLEEQTGLSVRQLAQSLLMSTAEPLREEARQLLVCPEAGRRPGQCGRRRHRQLLPDDG